MGTSNVAQLYKSILNSSSKETPPAFVFRFCKNYGGEFGELLGEIFAELLSENWGKDYYIYY